jgi:hypothetical protein
MEYLEEILIMLLFGISLWVTTNKAFDEGVVEGSEITLAILEDKKIIRIDNKGEVKGISPK